MQMFLGAGSTTVCESCFLQQNVEVTGMKRNTTITVLSSLPETVRGADMDLGQKDT